MLRHVLKHLSRDAPDVFPSNEPDDYPMLNAAATAESESLTKRSEAKDREIVNPENLKRVRRYVADRQVVAFGKKAQLACARAGSDVVARGRHLSFTNINRRITVPFQGGAATEERARIVAAEILGSIASSKASVPAEPLRFEKVGRSSA
jgi:hypothetical protein